MKVNEGFADRVIRVVIGLGVMAAPFVAPDISPWIYVGIPVGVALMLTGIFGVCPLYSALGVNTLGKHE